MTTKTSLLSALLPLVAELSRNIPEHERYRRLLAALRTVLPADAAALLRYEAHGAWLRPLATNGLSADTLGRRFHIAEHPRFAALLQAGKAMRFPTNTSLPDPYDGLVEHHSHAPLPVHDCMGCVLQVEGKPWGLLTLDALQPGQFAGEASLAALQAFSDLAAATVATVERIALLEQTASNERQRAEHFRRQAPQASSQLIGHSSALRQLQRDIATVATHDWPVLITGETGVGKELVAHAVHAQSLRADQAFVSINCAALPENLVESELFGHVRGAFTGAISDRQGKFEQAHQGTLFLDEVGELPMATQAKLLRVLQSGHIQRLGLDKERVVNVRIIAATNRTPEDAVSNGDMRADFFHRLNVFPLRVPPLRERDGDVLVLAGHFLEQTRTQLHLRGLRLAPDAQAALLSYPWPGNVRELEHCIRRAVLRAIQRDPAKGEHGTSIGAMDLQLLAHHSVAAALPVAQATNERPIPQSLRAAVQDYERQLIENTLQAHHYSWAATARVLHMDRGNLQRLSKRLGVRLPGKAILHKA